MQIQRRTLTGYGVAVLVVLAILNGLIWYAHSPKQHDLGVFSAGFSRNGAFFRLRGLFTDQMV